GILHQGRRRLARGAALRYGIEGRARGGSARRLRPAIRASDIIEKNNTEDVMREIGHFIGGKAVKGSSGRFGDVFDPNTGEVQAKVALASRAEVEQAIVNAAAAQLGWAATNPQRRARVLFKFL